MISGKNIIMLCLGFLLVVFNVRYLADFENELVKNDYSGKKGKTQFTVNAKLIGAKKAGADLLWINQVLSVGEQVGSYDNVEKIKNVPEMIKKNSEEITYLNPYFTGNYYFSASIVALIRIYNRHDYGMEILDTGVKYNPDDIGLKMYISGIIADYRGDDNSKLAAFESIIKSGVRDDMVTYSISFIYERKYKETKDEKYLMNAKKYWELLLSAKDEKYRKIAENKMEEYFNIEL